MGRRRKRKEDIASSSHTPVINYTLKNNLLTNGPGLRVCLRIRRNDREIKLGQGKHEKEKKVRIGRRRRSGRLVSETK